MNIDAKYNVSFEDLKMYFEGKCKARKILLI